MPLRFEPLHISHCDHIYNTNLGNVAEYFFNFKSIDASKEWVEKTLVEVSEGSKLEFSVFDSEVFVGMTALWIYSDKVGEISFWIAQEHQKQGCGKQMVDFMCGKARELELHELRYQIEEDNKASMRLIHSIGFDSVDTLEGGDMVYKCYLN